MKPLSKLQMRAANEVVAMCMLEGIPAAVFLQNTGTYYNAQLDRELSRVTIATLNPNGVAVLFCVEGKRLLVKQILRIPEAIRNARLKWANEEEAGV